MHNPLRSEADAFRWVVVIGVGRGLGGRAGAADPAGRRGDLGRAADRRSAAAVAYRGSRGSRCRADVRADPRRRRPAPAAGRRQRDGRRRGAARGDRRALPRPRLRDPRRSRPALAASRADALGLGHRRSDRARPPADGALADRDRAAAGPEGEGRDRRLRSQRRDRGRAAGLPGRRDRDLDPSAADARAGSSAASSTAPAKRSTCRSPTSSSTSPPRAPAAAAAASR